jgi:hypothetical protein
MAFQIFNDGAVIRIENGLKILLVSKEQVKTIDTIQNNVVRIDIGEGPLKNIFINYQDVTNPAVGSANELRDLIKQWMVSDNYNGGDATEAGQVNILNKLGDISTILETIKQREVDLTQTEPSRIDEANPYMVYKGWHRLFGDEQADEWAIQRITRRDDQIIYEWAFGTQRQIYKWWDRTNHVYAPYDHNLPVPIPVPPAPPVDNGNL